MTLVGCQDIFFRMPTTQGLCLLAVTIHVVAWASGSAYLGGGFYMSSFQQRVSYNFTSNPCGVTIIHEYVVRLPRWPFNATCDHQCCRTYGNGVYVCTRHKFPKLEFISKSRVFLCALRILVQSCIQSWQFRVMKEFIK